MSTNHDERIVATRQRWATHGFAIFFIALSIDLMVRSLILKQDPRQYLDISLIWIATMLYVVIGTTASGVEMHGGRLWKMWPLIPFVVVVNIVTLARMGSVPTFTSVAAGVVSATVGFLLIIVIVRAIYARWERRTLGRRSREG